MKHEKLKEVAEFIAQKAQDFPLEKTPFVNFTVHYSVKNDKPHIDGGVVSIGYAEINDDIQSTETVTVGQCVISQMKGCNGIAIISNLKIDEENRNKGLATYLIDLVNMICNKIDYTYIICTTKEENMPMRTVLAKNQYKEIFEFKNTKTNNEVVFCALNLSEYDKIVFRNNPKRSVIVSINSPEFE